MLCGAEIGFTGYCDGCGLQNKKSDLGDDEYNFVFKGNKVISLPASGDMSIQDFCKKNKAQIGEMIKEQEMAAVGYFKGKMCPFTQVNVGGTQNIGAAVLWGAPTYDELTWTHSECLESYCAIWDEKNKRCSIKSIASKLK